MTSSEYLAFTNTRPLAVIEHNPQNFQILMTPGGYKNIIDAVNGSIPFYTTHLETLRKLIDVHSKTTEYFVQVVPNIDLEEFNVIERMNKFNALLTISLLDLMVVAKICV